MTVSITSSQVGPYRGDDISTVFAVGFPFLENEHLHVVMTDAANEVCLVPDVDYHVIAAEAGDGQVELVQPLAVGKMLTISRKVPVTQLVNYVQGDVFPAKQHEVALDKLTMIAQELAYEVGRAVKLPDTDEGEFVLPSVSQRKNALLGFDTGGLPQAIKVGDGLITAQHMLMVNANIGIISNAAGVSLLIGDGLGAYNSAVVVKPGEGLDFDAQAQLRLKTELLNAINRNAATLVDLRGLLSNLMRRITNLEIGGGTEVTIYIGDGLRYDEDGNLTVKPGVGIEVNVDGVNVLLGDGLEVGAQGQMQVSQTLREGISQMQRNVNAGVSVPFNQELCAEIGGYPKGSVLLGADGVTLWQNTVDANMTDPDSEEASGWTKVNKSFSMNIQVFTSSGIYKPSGGMVCIVVEALGGGGGGGQTAAGPNVANVGGGGGAGGYCRKLFTKAEISANVSVIIGAGGTSNLSGSTTTFLTLTANGGGNGSQGSSAVIGSAAAGTGGSATGGDINIPGESGGVGWWPAEVTGVSGVGAHSKYGRGGQARVVNSGLALAGMSASGYGAGGAGAAVSGNTTITTGGSGSSGIVIVTEYIFA
ncbi:hypothetical protein CUZ56_01872 [Saezia sanguinis]|uniref:Glycine-rich domain-containing protein n=1 Tax=Saezia sanguinis TaxID=1965230 RepID=A0A433SCW8_9BURK|nr:hypothetical protein CUZ56_01872 [Saezia sanguinis]